MHSIIKDLALQAGFCFWDDEGWKPYGEAEIDWAGRYDEEFNMFVELLLRDAASYIDNKIAFGIGDKLLERYGVENESVHNLE
jgi:hypothetical protein